MALLREPIAASESTTGVHVEEDAPNAVRAAAENEDDGEAQSTMMPLFYGHIGVFKLPNVTLGWHLVNGAGHLGLLGCHEAKDISPHGIAEFESQYLVQGR
ncbi:hypothetical protein EDD11_006770 [Mortierella claussenii]|nr:hypothetical protein EDD11_006770 [Mortierella claussenii]